MKLNEPHFLPGYTGVASAPCVPFSNRAWVLSFGNQLVSSDSNGLYFEGEFTAGFDASKGCLLLMRSFSRSNLPAFVRRFLFLGESILIMRNFPVSASS